MQPGDRIDQYTIQRPLGSGGMADVYLAWDGENRFPVALKLMHARAMSSATLRERFRREVAIAQQLHHPYLVRVYGSGTAPDGRAYMVMEYVDGGSLAELHERQMATGRPMAADRAAYLIRQVAAAMAYAHRRGVIHRDLKPGNVLLRAGGSEPVVTDLGIASIQGANPLTGTLETLGTPHYMAPEQARGSEQLDERADIYAMGVMLYELLTGRRPFEADSILTVLYKKLNEPPPALTTVRPDLDRKLAVAVETAMQPEPERRFRSTGDMVNALDQVLPASVLLSKSESGERSGPPTPVTPLSQTPPPATRTRRFPVWLLAVLGVLVIGGGLALTQLGPRRAAPAATAPAVAAVGGASDAAMEDAIAAAVATALATQAYDEGSVTVAPTSTLIPTSTLVAADAATATTRADEAIIAPDATEPPPTATRRPATATAQPPTATATATPTVTPAPRAAVSTGADLSATEPLTFEAFGQWARGDEDNGTFTQTTEQARSGRAAKLDYEFTTTGNDYVVFLQERQIAGEPTFMRLWVYGDGSGHWLNVWIRDSDGQSWQVPLGRVTHRGWKQMSGAIDVDQTWPWTHISGNDNGVVDYPVRFRGIVLDDYADASVGEGTIYLDDLTIGGGPLPAAGAGSGNSGAAATAPTPAATAGSTPAGAGGEIAVGEPGSILFASGGLILSTDPAWEQPVQLGVERAATCRVSLETSTGEVFNLYAPPRCSLAESGTVICPSPNESYEVVVSSVPEGSAIIVRDAGVAEVRFVWQGELDRAEGIRWSPQSAHFLFVVRDTVYRADPGGGYQEILPTAYDPQYSRDGSRILYVKPSGAGGVDLFVSSSDGANARNVTNIGSPRITCPGWRR